MKNSYTPLTYSDKALRFVAKIGDFAWGVMDYFGSATTLFIECIRQLFSKPFYPWLTVEQIYALGVKSLGLICITAFSTGLVMALQFGFGLERFGGKFYVPKVLAVSMVRELGPVFTCLMLAGRVGSGIASELGSMKVTQQIDAIRALGTSPIKRLVIPRVLAMMFITPLLTVLADIIGIFGGMLIGLYELKIGFVFYIQQSIEILDLYDVLMGTSKTVFFGLFIALTGCHFGLTSKGGTQGVGDATTKAVVVSSVLILMSDFILTKIFWIFR
jgi:phospholipid/cholesterol/gamma-HCH transport system permease protein